MSDPRTLQEDVANIIRRMVRNHPVADEAAERILDIVLRKLSAAPSSAPTAAQE